MGYPGEEKLPWYTPTKSVPHSGRDGGVVLLSRLSGEVSIGGRFSVSVKAEKTPVKPIMMHTRDDGMINH